MSFKHFEGCSWILSWFLILVVAFFGLACNLPGTERVVGDGLVLGGVFMVDGLSRTLGLLNILIFVSLFSCMLRSSSLTNFLLLVSGVSSVLCYCCIHGVWFWVFYELSILPLLVLLAVDSPYSERYVALWYFSGYVVLSSLPMFLCVLYLSVFFGSFDLRVWYDAVPDDLVCCLVGLLLSVLFVMKVPLVPFHTWLPVVHAEASSPVSVCLSGYVMKLGLLGVIRFCSGFVGYLVFNPVYLFVCLVGALGFFLMAVRELDVKRWLALMSLAHISVAALCISLGDYQVSSLCFVYSLGHGLSAACMFLLMWVMADLSGSRNFMLMKHSLWGNFSIRVVLCLSVCTVGCVPPTVQFFSEVLLVQAGLLVSNWGFPLIMYFYLFLGGFVPVLFLGLMLTRHFDVSFQGCECGSISGSVIFLVAWSFVLFLVF